MNGKILTVALSCMLFPCLASAQEWRGFPNRQFDAGSGPRSIVADDFNSDGIADVATTNFNSDDVSVLLGNGSAGVGDGTFASAVNYNAGDGPQNLTAADFNGDGITDFAIANFNSDNVSVLLGNGSAGEGDGTFAAATNYSAGNGPWDITAADFDDDGFTDLATTNRASDNVSVLLGNGSTFAAAVNYSTGSEPRGLTVADFDGDGINDLAIANFGSNDLSVLRGNGSVGEGDGTFAAAVSHGAGNGPQILLAADFDNDGVFDLAAANVHSDNVSVLLGNGDTFAAAVNYDVGDAPESVTAEDFNNDGITDIATANVSTHDISVLLGNGSTFAAAVNYNTGNVSPSLTAADFNGDGINDIASASMSSNKITVLLGNGNEGLADGTFAAAAFYSTGDGPRSVTAADFNGDDITDLATANSNSDNASVLLGNGSTGLGDGTFASAVNYSAGDFALSVTAADFNGDSITDFAIANTYSDNISVLLGNGTSFAAAVNYSAGNGPQSIAAVDLNGDGITDLATANSISKNVSVLLGNENAGKGDGTFASRVNYSVGNVPRSITTADFNGDGITDLAIANWISNDVSVLLGNGSNGMGDGTFAVAVNYSAGNGPYTVTAADFNGDSITDLAVANSNSHNVSVLLGNGSAGVGDGTFASPVDFDAGNEPQSITVADFNGDGLTDVATANYISDDVTVLLNLGFTESDIQLSNTAIAFGDSELGASASTLSVTVDSIGDADLVTTPSLTNDGGGVFAIDSLPTSPMATGTSDTLEVTFTPNGLGLFNGEIVIATNDSTSPTITIALSGTGIDTQTPTSAVTGPTGTLTQPSPTFDVTYTASDNAGGSGIASIKLYYQRDGGGYTSYGTFTSSPISFDTSTTGGDGTYDFYTIATDTAANAEAPPVNADASVNFNDNTSVQDWGVLDQ